MTRTSEPPRDAKCTACGVIGTLEEMTQAEGGVCRDEDACLGRMMRHPGNMPDPYASVGLRLDMLRAQLDQSGTALAHIQDIVGHLRVAAYQAPQQQDARLNDDVLSDVCRVLAPEATEPESDPYYVTQAKAAILVARGGVPAAALLAHATTGDRGRQERTWAAADALWARHGADPIGAAMYAKVAAGEVIDRAQARLPECAEGRYDTRGDCDGIMLRAALLRPMNDLPAGQEVVLCRSHHVQAFNAKEVGHGHTLPPPVPEPEGEVILREGVVVRSGDTLVLSYPAGTPYQKMNADRRVIAGSLPDGCRITLAVGVQVSVIRSDEAEV